MHHPQKSGLLTPAVVVPPIEEVTRLLLHNSFPTAHSVNKIYQKLAAQPELVNQQESKYQATPLMTAMVVLAKYISAGQPSDAQLSHLYRDFIKNIILNPDMVIDLLVQDCHGSTFLHRASWSGGLDLAILLLQTTFERSLSQQFATMIRKLKKLRNHQKNIRAKGETVVDNVRYACLPDVKNEHEALRLKAQMLSYFRLQMQPQYSDPIQKLIETFFALESDPAIRAIPSFFERFVNLVADGDVGGPDVESRGQWNRHFSTLDNTDKNTPLYFLLASFIAVKDKHPAAYRYLMRQHFCDLLETHQSSIDFFERSSDGGTLLHRALRNWEWQIANQIIAIMKKTDEKKAACGPDAKPIPAGPQRSKLERLLQIRNTEGVVHYGSCKDIRGGVTASSYFIKDHLIPVEFDDFINRTNFKILKLMFLLENNSEVGWDVIKEMRVVAGQPFDLDFAKKLLLLLGTKKVTTTSARSFLSRVTEILFELCHVFGHLMAWHNLYLLFRVPGEEISAASTFLLDAYKKYAIGFEAHTALVSSPMSKLWELHRSIQANGSVVAELAPIYKTLPMSELTLTQVTQLMAEVVAIFSKKFPQELQAKDMLAVKSLNNSYKDPEKTKVQMEFDEIMKLRRVLTAIMTYLDDWLLAAMVSIISVRFEKSLETPVSLRVKLIPDVVDSQPQAAAAVASGQPVVIITGIAAPGRPAVAGPVKIRSSLFTSGQSDMDTNSAKQDVNLAPT